MSSVNEDKSIVAVPMGKDEMNLVEFPITLLSNRDMEKVKTLEFSDIIFGEGNKMTKREWIVTGSDKFGLPLANDNDILLSILQIGKERNFESSNISFSRYKLCKMIGLRPGGSAYKRIESALDRLVGVRIKAKNAFWDNIKKGYVTVNFGIIDSYSLLTPSNDKKVKGKRKNSKSITGNVVLNSVLFQSIRSGYIKNVDLKLYFGLKSVVSKRLYRYLDKKSYRKSRFEINLFTLAFEHLGLSRSRPYASQIKQCLNPAHDELIENGFLESTKYEKTADGKSEKVIYYFNKKARFEKIDEPIALPEPEELPEKPVEAEVCKTENDIVFETLIANGVTEGVARQLVRNYSIERITRQIDLLPFRDAREPAAVLVKAVHGDWAPPACYYKHIEKKKRSEKIKKKKENEEEIKAARREKVESYISSLSDEEEKELMNEAEKIARAEGKAIFKNKKIPDFMIRSYMYVISEKRLGLNSNGF